MKKENIIKGLALLGEANLINVPDMTDEKLKKMITLWMHFFKDINPKHFFIAILQYIKNNTFFPTINKILELIPKNEKYPPSYEIYNIYKNEDYTTIEPLIIKAFERRGLDRYALENLDVLTIQKNILPAVIKIYEQLVEKEIKANEILEIEEIISEQKLIESKAKKQITYKKETVISNNDIPF